MKSLFAFAALCVVSLASLASTDPQQLTIRDIVTQQTQLRAQVAAGKGAFRDLSKREREDLMQRQDRVITVLGGMQTIEDIPPHQRTEIFNDLEWIKSAVTKAEDDRKVCEYTRIAGSNRVQSVCMTAKQQREQRDRARDVLNRGQMCGESSMACLGDTRNQGLGAP